MYPPVIVVISVFSIGWSSIFIVMSDSPPLVIAFWRMLLATLMLLPFSIHAHGKDALRPGKYLGPRAPLILLGIGAILAIHFGTWIASLQYTTVAISVVLVCSHPILLVGLGAVRGERPSRTALVGLLVAFIGILLLSIRLAVGEGSDLGSSPVLGGVLAFIGAIAMAVYLVGGRRCRGTTPLFVYVTWVYGGAALVLLPFALASGQAFIPSQRELGLFVLMALIPSLMGHTMYNYALKWVRPSTVSISILGEPILSTSLAIPFLDQVPSWLFLVEGALILGGIFLVARDEFSRPDT